MTEDQIREALATVKYPGFTRDVVSFGLVKNLKIEGNDVMVQMALTTADARVPQQIKSESERALAAVPGIGKITVRVDIHAPTQTPGQATQSTQAALAQTQIDGVKHVIAVASGKGGVGKSTVAANLAVALHEGGASVGLCDCDLYGPSVALMFGTSERPYASDDNRILPIEKFGLKLMSMGFLLDDAAPAILRGPMVTKYTQQFLRQVDWGDLDYLILDLPPGTGDIQLTIVQTITLTGAIVVTTPQEVALIDARKASSMFQKVNVPVIGLVENMSYFQCPSDNKRYDIFGTGGGEREAERLKVPLLGQIPIDIPTREAGDRGCPVVLAEPKSAVSEAFRQVATRVIQAVAR
ncbi:MAG TPA: Mrp/NBP35 family ATP-binding protein [Chthoniobacteraceae bacterium]|nr:Mrp/NBP35 family ATP-binding protein [Chthoniobacteraceae bacterium]